MVTPRLRVLLVLVGLLAVRSQAQTVQPGLESAVKWKWWVLPSEEKEWGLPLPEPIPEPVEPVVKGPTVGPKDPSVPAGPSIAPGDYEVKKGDALAIIARKSGVPVTPLKRFNGLEKDVIRIGQILKIPTPAEVIALAPPPPTPAPPQSTPAPKKARKTPEKPPAEPVIDYVAEATLIQVFLDRENFSPGPIDGNQTTALQTTSGIYSSVHPGLESPEALRAKAVAVVGEPFTTYKLQRADFRFIAPPKATIAPKATPAPKPTNPPVGSKSKKPGAKTAPTIPPLPPRPPVTYDDLLAASFSAYHSPWEFVAEKFHCDEGFLRSLNPNIKNTPIADTSFKVPNVTPFEIEKSFDTPLRPKADPVRPITAAIAEFSRLEIRRGEQLIAIMPMSRARPGLRGKGSWTILGATVGPRLATRQEPTTAPKPTTELGGAAIPSAVPPPPATTLAADQIIAAGPRNPVGIYWIDLAKADSTTPLPYGLHGTAIPGRMKVQESLGGLRLTNWDIARAVHMLPEGTPLLWK